MAKTASLVQHAVGLCAATFVVITSVAAQSPVPSPEKSGEGFKNLKVLNNTPSDLLLPSMEFITSSLGVHCEYCHVEKAFEKDDKKPKQTAREMMRMVEEINQTTFQGKQEVTCYSCHRGSPKPLTIPVIAKVPPRLATTAVLDDAPAPAGAPSPADVISKYITARGGRSALSTLASLEERGTFDSDSQGFPTEIYVTRSGRSATIIHLPGADRVTTFNGTSGWLLFPGRPGRSLSAAEVDAIRLNADLQFGLDLNTVFPEIKFSGFANLGAADSVMLSGIRPGLPPVEMYFDKISGLLLRTVYYSPSALGLNPTQTDYSDYRKSGLVKISFHWTSSTPTGKFNIHIASVRENVNIPEEVFPKAAAK